MSTQWRMMFGLAIAVGMVALVSLGGLAGWLMRDLFQPAALPVATATATAVPTATFTPTRLPSPTATPTSTPRPLGAESCLRDWQRIESPSLLEGDNILLDVAAVGANDIWAVGYAGRAGQYRTMAMHWDGRDWRVVRTPNQDSGNNSLIRLAAIGPDDIWAAGHVDPVDGGVTQTILMHWDGTSWQLDPEPFPGTLLNIHAVASDDIWAVGYEGDAGFYSTLILHWDGISWSKVASPNAGDGENYLAAVAAFAPDDVWAMGYLITENPHKMQNFALHWDGVAWEMSSLAASGGLYYAATVGEDKLFTVGYAELPGRAVAAIRVWDGQRWREERVPNTGDPENYLDALAVLGPNNVWAVGHFNPPNGGYTSTILLNWDGSRWKLDPYTSHGQFRGITATADGDLWVVGYGGNRGSYHTIIEYAQACGS